MKRFTLEGRTMEEQAAELLARYGLQHVREVRMTRYWINGKENVVGLGKYFSALILQYLAEVAEKNHDLITAQLPMAGVMKTFTVTAEMRDLISAYFEKQRCEDAIRPDTKHTTVRDLLYGGFREPTVRLEMFEVSVLEDLVMSCSSYTDLNVHVPDLARWFPNVPVPNSVLAVAKRVSERVFDLANRGAIRAARPSSGDWVVNGWFKSGILLYFRSHNSEPIGKGFFDKVPLKYADYDEARFMKDQIRVVSNAVIRGGAYIGPDCVIMSPAFVNIGAHVGERTMVDSHALVGSCAQVGSKCHLSAGVQVGGVLEPPEAHPVCIGDCVMVGAGCVLLSGVQIGDGCFLGKGVAISGNTVVYDTVTGEEHVGKVPPNSVVKMAALASKPFSSPKGHDFHPIVPVVTKHVTEENRKQVMEELLREQ